MSHSRHRPKVFMGKARLIATDFPHVYRPARRKPINLDQDNESVAKDIALKYGGDILIWEFNEQTNSLMVMFTDRRKFRIYFNDSPTPFRGGEKEKSKNDNQESNNPSQDSTTNSNQDEASPARDIRFEV